MESKTFEVTLQPVGRHVEVPSGTSLLEAARLAGVELVTICGGTGACGTCRVHPVSGVVSPPSLTEQAELSPADLSGGMRLACETRVLGNVRVDIPPESLSAPQRLQVEGQETATELDPPVTALEIEVPPPSLEDLRSDLTRLRQALPFKEACFGGQVLGSLSTKLRQNHWRLRLARRGNEIVAVFSPGQVLYGLAVDVGTTKLATYLVNLETGGTAAKSGAMNPQIAYGEDVISRIHYTNEHPDGARNLQTRLVETINGLASGLCKEADIQPEQIVEAVVVGNTAMHHLFTGLPVRQLGEAPYVAAVSEALEIRAADLGLQFAPGAYVYLPPNVAGYVGADHISMLIGADLARNGGFVKHADKVKTDAQSTILALDIGTNTEISLFHQDRHWACSCASGPAFEGAHIRDGMRAAPGAIERVRIRGEEVRVQTIGGGAAVGICGSGILDGVAELVKTGLVNQRGALEGSHPRLVTENGKAAFILVPAGKSGTGRAVMVNRADINEIQLAKGAIRTGVEILLQEAGIKAESIQQFIIAGAFGTYLNLESAIRIGMFPDIPRQRYQQVGNAAGSGARRLLLSKGLRGTADQIAGNVEYVELAKHPDFTRVYVKALGL